MGSPGNIDDGEMVASDIDKVEQDIARAREDLATTLDSLVVRANPQRLVDDAKSSIISTVNTPAVKYSLVGVGVLAVALTIRKIFR